MSQHRNCLDFDSPQTLDLLSPSCDLLPAGLLEIDTTTETMQPSARVNVEYGDESQPPRPADDDSMETSEPQTTEPPCKIESTPDTEKTETRCLTIPTDSTHTKHPITPGPELRPRLRIEYDPQPSAPPRRKKGMSGKVRHSLLLALQALTSGRNPDSSLPSITVEADSAGPTYRSDVVLLRRLEEARPVHRLRRPTRLARQLVLLARDVKSDPDTVRARLLMLADEAETLDLNLDVPDFRVLGERGIRLALVHGGADWVGLRSLPNDVLCHVKYELRYIVGVSAISAAAPQSTEANPISTGPLASPTGFTPDFTISESSSAFTPTTSGSGSTPASSLMSGSTSPKLLDSGAGDRFENPSTANTVSMVSDAAVSQSTSGLEVVGVNTNETTVEPVIVPSKAVVAPDPSTLVLTTANGPQDDEGGLDGEKTGMCPSRSNSSSSSDVISCPTRGNIGTPQLEVRKSGHLSATTSDAECFEKCGNLLPTSATESTASTEADDTAEDSEQLNLNMSMNLDEDRQGKTRTFAQTNYETDGIEVDFTLNTTSVPQSQKIESPFSPGCMLRNTPDTSKVQAEYINGFNVKEPDRKGDFERGQCNTKVEKCRLGNAQSQSEEEGSDKTLCRVSMDMNIEVSSNICSYQHFELQTAEQRHSFGAVEADRRRRRERRNVEWARLKREHRDMQSNVQEMILGLEKTLEGLRKHAVDLERQWESVAKTSACQCGCTCRTR